MNVNVRLDGDTRSPIKLKKRTKIVVGKKRAGTQPSQSNPPCAVPCTEPRSKSNEDSGLDSSFPTKRGQKADKIETPKLTVLPPVNIQSDSDTTDTDTDNPDDGLPVWHPQMPKTVDLYYIKRKKRRQNEASSTVLKSNPVPSKAASTLPVAKEKQQNITFCCAPNSSNCAEVPCADQPLTIMQSDSDSDTSSSSDGPDDTLPVWHVQGPKTIDQYYVESKKRKEAQKEVERKKKEGAQNEVVERNKLKGVKYEVASIEVKSKLTVPQSPEKQPVESKKRKKTTKEVDRKIKKGAQTADVEQNKKKGVKNEVASSEVKSKLTVPLPPEKQPYVPLYSSSIASSSGKAGDGDSKIIFQGPCSVMIKLDTATGYAVELQTFSACISIAADVFAVQDINLGKMVLKKNKFVLVWRREVFLAEKSIYLWSCSCSPSWAQFILGLPQHIDASHKDATKHNCHHTSATGLLMKNVKTYSASDHTYSY